MKKWLPRLDNITDLITLALGIYAGMIDRPGLAIAAVALYLASGVAAKLMREW